MATGRSLGILLCAVFGALLPTLASGQPASLLLDIAPGSDSGLLTEFYGLRKAGDRLYFASDGGGKGGLWVSDGTSLGTEPLADLCPDTCGPFSSSLGALGKLMLWSAGSYPGQPQLWRTDGTRPGTLALTDPEVEVLTGEVYEPEKPYAFLGRFFYFVGCSWEGDVRDCDLWQTDGSVAGTHLLREIPGLGFAWLFAAGDRVYFVTTVDDGGSDLWATDGTAAGTVKLHRFPGQFVRPASPVAAGGRLFFVASEGGSESGSRGREIWRTDGTLQGTFQVTDFKPDQPFRLDGRPFAAVLDGTLVFVANDGLTYSGLWATRGTPQTTVPLPCEDCRFDPFFSLVAAGGKAFCIVIRSDRTSVWVTDGTVIPWNGGALLDVASSIWFSDGTSAGTRPLRSLTDARASLLEVEEVGGYLYYFAEGPETRGLWALDRQEKSRPVFVPPAAGASSGPERLTAFGGKLLFTASGDLWSSAGTAETTSRANLPQDFRWEDASDFVRVGGLLFFQVEGGPLQEHDLWRTDGTAQGTMHLADLPGETVLVPYQGALYFFADGEIWKSDGSPAGTVKTGDLPGEEDIRVEAGAAGRLASVADTGAF